ncbi:hypothetical protein B0H14DRAFT_3606709 [Mycena olivaceomarginata]|nr:hypothetical protein B0H14DRAFT_3606709 [Mycena olivaceomarginata]
MSLGRLHRKGAHKSAELRTCNTEDGGNIDLQDTHIKDTTRPSNKVRCCSAVTDSIIIYLPALRGLGSGDFCDFSLKYDADGGNKNYHKMVLSGPVVSHGQNASDARLYNLVQRLLKVKIVLCTPHCTSDLNTTMQQGSDPSPLSHSTLDMRERTVSDPDRDLYSRLLLAKGCGYPLSYPQPSDDLRIQSQGIQIGDVGVLTSEEVSIHSSTSAVPMEIVLGFLLDLKGLSWVLQIYLSRGGISPVLGLRSKTGELYLVTGVDKSSSWMVGAAANQSQDRNISLNLKGARTPASGRRVVDCGFRTPSTSGEDPSTKNQTVFLRGFRIALHRVAWTKISQAIPVVDSKRLTFFSKAWFKSVVKSQPPGSISSSPNTGQHTPEESAAIASFLQLSALAPRSKGMVAAVTHDNEWKLAMGESVTYVSQSIQPLILVFWKESVVPSKHELITRIRARCTMDFGHGGYSSAKKRLDSLEKPPFIASSVTEQVAFLGAFRPILRRKPLSPLT